jgi:hypothetical protein
MVSSNQKIKIIVLIITTLITSLLVAGPVLASSSSPDDVLSPSSDQPGTAQCTYAQGYWKNHPQAWPVASLTLGNTNYSQAELLTIFNTPPRGDATYILAHHLIAAKLNLAAGADTSAVASTIADADNWLAQNPLGSDPNNPARSTGIAYSDTLDDYTNGVIGPGKCNDTDDNEGEEDDTLPGNTEGDTDNSSGGDESDDTPESENPQDNDADESDETDQGEQQNPDDAESDNGNEGTQTDTISVDQKISPVVECVADKGDGSYLAYFGYYNRNDIAVDISVGSDNKMTGGGLSGTDQGQPTTFEPGRQYAAFSVMFNGSNLVWFLRSPNGQAATATASTNPQQRCDPDGDMDGDGLTNQQEINLGTQLNKADSDGDGVDDKTEVGDPSSPTDSNGDGIPDVLDPNSQPSSGQSDNHTIFLPIIFG